MKPVGTPARVFVIGDAMMDVDLHFTTVRQSPEGVPVVTPEPETPRLGGAGAVALMAHGLGGDVVFASVTGDDETSREIVRLVNVAGVRHILPSRPGPATTKTRIFLDGKQQWRIDQEITTPVSDGYVKQLLDVPDGWTPDVVLVADYAKGVVTDGVMRGMKEKWPDVTVIVDPGRGVDWEWYRGADCICPGRNEAEGNDIQDWMLRLSLEAAVYKRDVDGVRLFQRNHRHVDFPATNSPGDVIDTAGAGDMVLAAVGVFIGEGHAWNEAARLANQAAGAKCKKRGAVSITRAELFGDFINEVEAGVAEKIGALRVC